MGCCTCGLSRRQAGNTPRREIIKGLPCQATKCDLYPEGKGSLQKDFKYQVIRSDMCFRKIILSAPVHSTRRRSTSSKPLKYSSWFLRKGFLSFSPLSSQQHRSTIPSDFCLSRHSHGQEKWACGSFYISLTARHTQIAPLQRKPHLSIPTGCLHHQPLEGWGHSTHP